MEAVDPSKVDRIVKTLPRYLFRAWTPSSGGNSRLNTTEAVTPHAFLDEVNVKSFYDTPCSKLAQLANEHLTGGHCRTVYSSWSQSLSFVLSLKAHCRSAHISILDVSKLPSSNVVMPTWRMTEVLQHHVYDYYIHEYLAFGIVSGACYEAVPLDKILAGSGGLASFCPFGHSAVNSHTPGSILKTRLAAFRTAKLYRAEFQLAIATYLLAMGADAQKVTNQAILTVLADLVVPEDWKIDHRVLKASSMDTKDFRETIRAAKLLEQLALSAAGRLDSPQADVQAEQIKRIKAALGQGRGPEGAEGAEDVEEDAKSGQVEERPETSIMKSSRISREVKNLYIDLIGWR